MIDPNFVLLYVNDPTTSAAFYAELLGRSPLEASPTFAMFALSSGTMLGLWARNAVAPAASMTGGGAELAFALDNDEAVVACYTQWATAGRPILQIPTRLDFGYTFVAADPDGHRLRVFAPGAA